MTLCNAVGPDDSDRMALAHSPLLCQCEEPDEHRDRGQPHQCGNCGRTWFDPKGGTYPGPPPQRLGIVDRPRRTRFWRGHR